MGEKRGFLRWELDEGGGGNASLYLGDEVHEADEYFFSFDSLDELDPGMTHVIRSDGRRVGEATWPPVS